MRHKGTTFWSFKVTEIHRGTYIRGEEGEEEGEKGREKICVQ